MKDTYIVASLGRTRKSTTPSLLVVIVTNSVEQNAHEFEFKRPLRRGSLMGIIPTTVGSGYTISCVRINLHSSSNVVLDERS